MSNLSPLITDLTLILVVAGFFSLLFKWLKQPVVLAYIVAGIALSFVFSKTGPRYENIRTWADIGIIFLLFGLGLEFNFKKLLQDRTYRLDCYRFYCRLNDRNRLHDRTFVWLVTDDESFSWSYVIDVFNDGNY